MQTEIILTIVTAIFASTGFWTFITTIRSKDTLQIKMLKGLAHDRICSLGESYVNRGYVTKDEYENLHDYLFLPYKQLGGNGTAERIMREVDALPFR